MIDLTEQNLKILEILEREKSEIEHDLLLIKSGLGRVQLDNNLKKLERHCIVELTTASGGLIQYVKPQLSLYVIQRIKIIEDLQHNSGKMDYDILLRGRIIDADRFNRILNDLNTHQIIEIQNPIKGKPSRSSKCIILKKRKRPNFMLILIVVVPLLFLAITPLVSRKWNLLESETLNFFGLFISFIGALLISFGSIDNFLQIKINGGHTYKKLLKKWYSGVELSFATESIRYPILRYNAAELGPWVISIGFLLQIFALIKGT